MRIVAGKYGGRRLSVPKGRDIRPTSDKVRGAIFNALRSRGAVDDALVLDAFSGSGALGLEALSQGAKHCIFIDKARESLSLTRQNVEGLGAADDSQLILKDASKIGQRPGHLSPVRLVFLDPPYAKGLVLLSLEALSEGDWLVDGAIIVVEAERSFNESFPASCEVLDEKIYGDTKVMFLRYQASIPE